MSFSTSLTRSGIAAGTHTHDATLERQALLFTTIIVAASMFLQRFGLPVGGKTVNLVGVIGLGTAMIGLSRGVFTFSQARLSAFVVLSMLALIGLAYHQMSPALFAASSSLASVSQFLLLSGFATLSFTVPISEAAFFRRINAIFAIIAAAGIVQFLLQFVGINLFAFSGILPAALLTEDSYNLQIPIGVGSLLKSNGFFLLEPSIFSQFMAMAMIVEIVAFRRAAFLGLFAGGLLLSMSGTGWIVLASFIATVAFSMGRRGVVISIATFGVLTILVVSAATLAPDVAAAFSARLDEVFRQSTSGHMRFVTPFWLLDEVFSRDPSAWLLGIGGGISEQLSLPYEYDVNTPVKIAIEYGIPSLIAYVVLFAAGQKTSLQRALLVPGMVLLMFGGGYQQFAPGLFPILLMMSVGFLRV